jgi:hypothetical protein
MFTFMIVLKTASESYYEPAIDPVCTFTTEISILKLSSRNTLKYSQTLPSLQFSNRMFMFYSSMRSIWLNNFILLDLLNSRCYSGQYNLCNTSICNVFHLLIYSFSYAQIFSSALCSLRHSVYALAFSKTPIATYM